MKKVLCLTTGLLLIAGAASASDGATSEIKNSFKEYAACGRHHFGILGQTEKRAFAEVEATIARPCGKWISMARSAMATLGLDRPTQTEVITTEYNGTKKDFERAYLEAQRATIGSAYGIAESDLNAVDASDPGVVGLDAAHDEILDGINFELAQMGLLDPSAVKNSDRAANMAEVLRSRRAPKSLIDQAYDAVDPRKKLSESERTMAALGMVYSHYVKTGEPEKAKAVATSIIQHQRHMLATYSSIAKAAMQGREVDDALEAAVRAYASMPDGNDIKVKKLDNGRYELNFIDEATGKIVSKPMLTPQEIGGWAMRVHPSMFDEFIAVAAGESPGIFALNPDHSDPSEAQTAQVTSGSGIIVSTEGHILTNHHVIAGCYQATIHRAGQTPIPAVVMKSNVADDLALLKIPHKLSEVSVARLKPWPPAKAGQGTSVFGFPLPSLLSSTGNIASGNISSLAGPADDSRLLQISVPIQPGNSGGPLLDDSAAVVGVVVAKLDEIKSAAQTGAFLQNVNFAIKASVAVNFLDSQSIPYLIATENKKLEMSSIVEIAQNFTVRVQCRPAG